MFGASFHNYNRHTGTDFHLCNFFNGRLLYQGPDTSELYYGDADESDREKILSPERKKRKARGKVRPARERGPLRAITWLFRAHTNDPLAAVLPPSFILNTTEITSRERVTNVLDQTEEWKAKWSEQIYSMGLSRPTTKNPRTSVLGAEPPMPGGKYITYLVPSMCPPVE